MRIVLRDRPIPDFNRKRFYLIDILERWSGHIWDRRELSRNIAEFSTAGKRIIITSVRGIPDNSTVIKDRLPPFVVYIFITNIRKVLPYCIVRSMEMCAADRTYCYQRLCSLMHVSNSSLACFNLMEDTSFDHMEICAQRNLRIEINYWISNFWKAQVLQIFNVETQLTQIAIDLLSWLLQWSRLICFDR